MRRQLRHLLRRSTLAQMMTLIVIAPCLALRMWKGLEPQDIPIVTLVLTSLIISGFWTARILGARTTAGRSFVLRVFPSLAVAGRVLLILLLLQLAMRAGAYLLPENSPWRYPADPGFWLISFATLVEGIQGLGIKVFSGDTHRPGHDGIVDMVWRRQPMRFRTALGGTIGVELRRFSAERRPTSPYAAADVEAARPKLLLAVTMLFANYGAALGGISVYWILSR